MNASPTRAEGTRLETFRRAQADELGELIATDGLPEDKYERLAMLREASNSDQWVPTHCPECGVDLFGVVIPAHAESHWPREIEHKNMSAEALLREAALYRAAGTRVPARG